jgi:hypothetical protein
VAALAAAFGPTRTLVLARELTKLFESIHSCRLGEAHDWLLADADRQRGEFVLLVSGAPAATDNAEGERVLALLLDDAACQSRDWRRRSRLAKKTLYQRECPATRKAPPSLPRPVTGLLQPPAMRLADARMPACGSALTRNHLEFVITFAGLEHADHDHPSR